MARISVIVDERLLEGDNGKDVAGVKITCTRCKHSVEVFGTGTPSIRRGCAMLHSECPEKQNNFYAPLGK